MHLNLNKRGKQCNNDNLTKEICKNWLKMELPRSQSKYFIKII